MRWGPLRAARAQPWLALGLAAAVAVTAALWVAGAAMGAGLRSVLEGRVEAQLGPVATVISRGGRGLSEGAVRSASEAADAPAAGVWIQPATAQAPEGAGRGVQLLGVDAGLSSLRSVPLEVAPGQVRLTERVGRELGVRLGDRLVLRAERPGGLGRDVALMQDVGLEPLSAEVGPWLPEGWPARFSTTARTAADPVALVSRAWLQARLGVEGRVNQVWIGAGARPGWTRTWQLGPEDADLIREAADLRTDCPEQVMRSPRVLLPPAVVARAEEAGWRAVTTGLADMLRRGDQALAYALVGGAPEGLAVSPVVGVPEAGAEGVAGIVLSEWAAERLQASVGDEVTVVVPRLGARRELTYETVAARVTGLVAVEGPAADATWAPPIEGLYDAETCASWDSGLPLDLTRVTDDDERFWDRHGAAPKAWVSAQTARRWFSTPHGVATGLRHPDCEAAFPALTPQEVGARVLDVRANLEAASAPANDFSALFWGFEAVLWVSALALTWLQVRLLRQRRADELGLLVALGFSRRQIYRRVAMETATWSLPGALVGVAIAPAWADWLGRGLAGPWSRAVSGVGIEGVVPPQAWVQGVVAGVLVAVAADVLATRALLSQPARQLLGREAAGAPRATWGRVWRAVGAVGLLGGVLLSVTSTPERTPEAALRFFAAGACWLAAGLAAVSWGLSRSAGRGAWAAAARQPGRALSVALSVACGVFLVVGVGLGGGRGLPDATDPHGGAGGFALYAETRLPLVHGLGTPAAEQALGLPRDLLVDAQVVGLPRVLGDDASCRQLGRAQAPTLLGVPEGALEGRFTDDASLWARLALPRGDGILPVIADEATATWGLHLGVGDRLTYVDGRGEEIVLELVGLLPSSVFQGALLVDSDRLAEAFPGATAPSVFLVDSASDDLAAPLSRALAAHGGVVRTTADQLERFAGVEATYVAIFRTLGGLGLVLGAAGTGVLLLRTVEERRGELALRVALGFSRRAIVGGLVAEHAVPVLGGLVLGGASAAVAVWPVLASPQAAPPWGEVAASLVGLVAVAALALTVAAWAATGQVTWRELARERR